MTGEMSSELERENSEVMCSRRKKKAGPEVRETLVIAFAPRVNIKCVRAQWNSLIAVPLAMDQGGYFPSSDTS